MIVRKLKELPKHVHKEHVQCWTALLLTCGEFVAGGWLLIHEGHVLAMYLAVTYAMRETSGGKHYHEIVMALIRRRKGGNNAPP